jgi:hypothetical protein
MKHFANCFLLLAIISSCSKSSSPTSDPPIIKNEIKATISREGSTAQSYSATNDQTVFIKRIDGDTVYVMDGAMADGQVDIMLINITRPGTYAFETSSASRMGSICDYTIGSPFAPAGLYSTTFNNQPNGQVIIESITPTSIKGSFYATCTSSTGKLAQITNGTFKGEF